MQSRLLRLVDAVGFSTCQLWTVRAHIDSAALAALWRCLAADLCGSSQGFARTQSGISSTGAACTAAPSCHAYDVAVLPCTSVDRSACHSHAVWPPEKRPGKPFKHIDDFTHRPRFNLAAMALFDALQQLAIGTGSAEVDNLRPHVLRHFRTSYFYARSTQGYAAYAR